MKSKNGNTSLSPLSDKAKQLLGKELTGKNKPVAPTTMVSNLVMAMKDNRVAIRNLFLIPWIAGMLFVLYLQADDIYSSWKAEELFLVHYVDLHYEDYVNNNIRQSDHEIVKLFLSVLEERKLPLYTYISRVRYSKNFVAHPDEFLHEDIFRTTLATSLILLLGIISIRMKRHEFIYFDRDRKLIYTWRSGRVWAQRYENLSYTYNPQVMFLYLRFLVPDKEENPLGYAQYQIQPSGNPYTNPWSQQEPVLAAIVKFMEQGQEAVWPTDWEGRKNFYFFKDKKPEDFDRQLTLILKKIDEEKAAEALSQDAESNQKRGQMEYFVQLED
ncbi:MAG: hypothetical protein P8171_22715 [Candidatus Thiodiazotropha sp.]